MIRVAVFGAGGRMGAASCQAVEEAEGLELVARIDEGDDRAAAASADVAIDFTHPDAVMGNVEWCLRHGLSVVCGTTGWTDERRELARGWLAEHPGTALVIAANFSIGAILMMRFAEQAARFYESVEVVELHHPTKADAPSGTATTTARRVAAARAEAGRPPVPDATRSGLEGARGADVDGIAVHSVRLRGLVAHQEVLFGDPGETLTIRHDSFDRVSFMPGVVASVRAVVGLEGLTEGIEGLLGLD